jgi:hypothetical protein
MNKHLFRAILAIAGVLVVAIAGIIFIETIHKGTSAAAIQNHLPITILYLDGSIVHFNCLDASKCFPDIDLGNQIKTANNPDEHPLEISVAYYGNGSIFYLLLTGSAGQYLAKVNLETRRVQILDPSPFIGGLGPGMASIVQSKLVLVTVDGKISIVQDEFSVKTIADLKAPILDFIETKASKIAAISTDSLLQNGSRQIKIFLVNINSGDVEEKILNGPQEENWWFVTVDQDIKRIYLIPATGTDSYSTYINVLHMFDPQAQKNILSVPISNFDALTYTTQTAKRYQYHGIWYYSRRCCQEGPYPAMLVNMSTLKPVVNSDDLLKNESNGTFMVSPFGDNFLIGMNAHVLVVSPNGQVINTYNLPKEWVGRDYLLLEYRK